MLSHYKAVVWYTGDDLYVREPGAARAAPGRTKLFDDEILAARDFMNEGGKLLVTGQFGAPGRAGTSSSTTRWGDAAAPFCTPTGDGTGRSPTTRRARTSTAWRASNDFQQYWLGAYLPIGRRRADAAASLPLAGAGAVRRPSFGLNGADSAANQDEPVLVPDDVEHPAARRVPAVRAASQAIKIDGPPAFDPPDREPVRVLPAGGRDATSG